MGLLDKLWDDTVAGPRPETGLGKLRKYSSFTFRPSSGKEEAMDGGIAKPAGTEEEPKEAEESGTGLEGNQRRMHLRKEEWVVSDHGILLLLTRCELD